MAIDQELRSQWLDLRDLRAESLKVLARLVVPVGYVWLVYIIGRHWAPIPPAAWAGSVALVLLPLVAAVLRGRSVRCASGLFLLSTMVAASCAMALLGTAGGAYLFMPIIIFSSMLLGQASVFPMALVASGLIVAIGHVQMGIRLGSDELWFPIVVILWVTVGSWLSARSLNTAISWLWTQYARALSQEKLANERRGELRRAFAALEEATRRLERANGELIVARRDADRARSLEEQFVANVSHELRTPLNLVVGFAEMMYLEPDGYDGVTWSPELLGDVGSIYRAGRHLQSLVDDILDLSRIDAAQLPLVRQPTDLGAVVIEAMETVTPLFDQRGLTHATRLPDARPEVLLDRTRIRQVMLNLLSNALRFTDQGGIEVSVSCDDRAMRVTVRDTGGGISEDQLERVFERFQQSDAGLSRRGGAGLGLTISRQFVELHGGRMWAESSPGRGTAVHFGLPLPGAVPESSQLIRKDDRRQVDTSRTPLVVVEADATVVNMLGRHLARPGWATADALGALQSEMHNLQRRSVVGDLASGRE